MKKNKIDEIKIEATLNCIKDSETILNGEYYVIHSDYIIALEEEIEKLNQPNIIVKIGDAEEIREKVELLQDLQERINKALDFIKENSCLDEYNGNIVENYKYELENILKGDE